MSIRVDDTNQRDVRKVQSFRNHLRTQQDVGLASPESREDSLMAAFLAGCVHIHAQNAHLRKERLQFFLDFPGSCSVITKIVAFAFRTGVGDCFFVAAVMAFHRFAVHMQSQTDVTIRALKAKAAIPAPDARGITSFVQHQHKLQFFL